MFIFIFIIIIIFYNFYNNSTVIDINYFIQHYSFICSVKCLQLFLGNNNECIFAYTKSISRITIQIFIFFYD